MKHTFKLAVLFCGLLFLSLFSCQKELDDTVNKAFCAVAHISISDYTTAKVIETINYTYDSVLRRPKSIVYKNNDVGFNRTIFPSYKDGNIVLGALGTIVIDPSKRIKQFTNTLNMPNALAGNYFYSHNGQGQMIERIFDDGSLELDKTNFTYAGENIAGFTTTIGAGNTSFSAKVTYLTTQRILPENVEMYGELYPELLPFMPCFVLGRLGNFPINQIQKTTLPGNLQSSIAISNYVFNAAGYLTKFDVKRTTAAGTAIRLQYNLQYTCYQ